MNLVKLLTAESQINQSIYNLLENFYILLNDDNWIQKYIFWELDLLKAIGYDLNLIELVDKKLIDNKKKKEALSYLPKLNSELMKIAKTGVIKKGNATRNVSKITRKINSL